jgi:hypothetical protein
MCCFPAVLLISSGPKNCLDRWYIIISDVLFLEVLFCTSRSAFLFLTHTMWCDQKVSDHIFFYLLNKKALGAGSWAYVTLDLHAHA